MRFPVVVHKDEGSSYGVTVPDLPGCFSGGDTLDEALTNAQEAIAGHIETLFMVAEPLPRRDRSKSTMPMRTTGTPYAGDSWMSTSPPSRTKPSASTSPCLPASSRSSTRPRQGQRITLGIPRPRSAGAHRRGTNLRIASAYMRHNRLAGAFALSLAYWFILS
ncbi:UPF0150 protein Ta0767 [Geodia barretti]|uniref:UPF0150 protein Ta0767 n=1 Tax=Geodia barretti TaxID=519541 RepID=A0AA35WDN1_GEOBA|nr:UPF0150 protein Ta0767 [Geodia barretti]